LTLFESNNTLQQQQYWLDEFVARKRKEYQENLSFCVETCHFRDISARVACWKHHLRNTAIPQPLLLNHVQLQKITEMGNEWRDSSLMREIIDNNRAARWFDLVSNSVSR
jgi:hypothetical protein